MRRECKDNNQLMLTDEAAACIRQILYSYKVKLSVFNGMMNSFAVLLLGRPLKEEEFPSTQTIRLWLVRLSRIDRHRTALEDLKYFCEPNFLFGAPISWGLTTDDTQHVDKKHAKSHSALRTRGFSVSDNGKGKGFMVGAGWELLTTSHAVGETNKENADLNFKVLLERVHHDVLAFLNIYAFDNAALGEGDETHDLLMVWLEDKGSKWTHFFGVKREPIIINDFFHCCNILTSLASVKFSGDSSRNNLREFHPRRLLQHLHDICTRLKILSDHVAVKLLKEIDHDDIDRRTARERQERWKQNGESAQRYIVGCGIMIRGQCFWVRWAQEMVTYLDKSDFKYEVLEQIAKMTMNESIIISLTFEAELVSMYFDITYAYHAFGGENCERAGFRLMELPYLLINFIIPFWNKADEDPSQCFPKTMEAIDKMTDDDAKRMKKEQMKSATEAVVDRMAKLYERWFKPPLIFLFVTHPVHGPPILRVLLKCVSEATDDITENERSFDFDGDNSYPVDDFYKVEIDEEKQWGRFDYNSSDMPEDMAPWYEMLVDHKPKVLHWWQQLGFGTLMLRDELKDLSNENMNGRTNGRDSESATCLHDFFEKYPRIYIYLRAAVAHGPSNSHITEMSHSLTRQFFDPSIPSARLDDMLNFIMGQDHIWKEERRKNAETTRNATKGRGAGGRGSTKSLDLKRTQAMSGDQLDESLPPYSYEEIQALPPELQNETKLSKISAEGTTRRDKERKQAIIEKFEGIRQRKMRSGNSHPLDLDKLQQQSSESLTEHDENWSSRADTKRQEVIASFLVKTYYTSITGTIDGKRKSQSKFHREIERVHQKLSIKR